MQRVPRATAPASTGRIGSVAQGKLVGPDQYGQYYVDWAPDVKYKQVPDTKIYYREKRHDKHIARDDEWDEVERTEVIIKRKYYCYNVKADMFKHCPPPPPKWPRSLTEASVLDRPTEVSPSPVIGPELAWELDQVFVQGSSLGQLPDDVAGALRLAKVTKYVGGQVGVYFVETTGGTLVVKPLTTPCREYFGSQLCAALGIAHPETRLVTVRSAEGKAILKVLTCSELFKTHTTVVPLYFLVMSYVKGITLREAKKSEHTRSLIGDPLRVQKVVEDVGYIAALDFMLFYKDRSGVFGFGNKSNIMLSVRSKQIVGAVGIDQSVTLEHQGLSVCFYDAPPVDVIEKLMQEVASNKSDIGEKLWNGLPKKIKAIIVDELLAGNETLAPDLMLTSFKKGLKLLSYRLTEQKIEAIHSDLKKYYKGPDAVDPAKVKTAYNTIKTYSANL